MFQYMGRSLNSNTHAENSFDLENMSEYTVNINRVRCDILLGHVSIPSPPFLNWGCLNKKSILPEHIFLNVHIICWFQTQGNFMRTIIMQHSQS